MTSITIPAWWGLVAAFLTFGSFMFAGWLVRRAYARGWATAYRKASMDHAEHFAERLTTAVDVEVARRLAIRDHQERITPPLTLADIKRLEDEVARARLEPTATTRSDR